MEKNTSNQEKRLHDLRAVHSNFKQVLELIKSGHIFSPEEKAEILDELNGSLRTFQSEIQQMEETARQKHRLEAVGS